MRKHAFSVFRILAAILVLSSATPSTHAHQSEFSSGLGFMLGMDPRLDWKEFKTPRFHVVFPASLEPIAKKTAIYLEEVHSRLSPWLQWEPRDRIEVRVLDSTDSHNGMAAATLRIGITIWAAPPDAWSETSYAEDWLQLTCLHEYIHILNMDPTRTWTEGLRYLFGDVVRPNSLWTTWMLEGLAVYGESRFTRSGRGRSTLWPAILRAAVEENRFQDSSFMSLDRLIGTNPWFPGGAAVYLFGYELMSDVAHDTRFNQTLTTSDGQKVGALPYGGEMALGELSRRSAARIPFFFDDNLRKVVGHSWGEIWARWQARRQTELAVDLHALQNQALTPYRTWVANDFAALGSVVSPSGNRIAYSLDSLHDRMGLYLLDRETGKSSRIADKSVGVGMAFTPDEQGIVFSSLERQSVVQQFSDLAFFDLKRRKTFLLTAGRRAKDPDLHRDPTGIQWVVFAQNESDAEAGTTSLWRATLKREDGESPSLHDFERLWKPATLDRIAQPKFSPDGTEIAFSWKVNGELGERFCRMPIATRQPECLQDGSFNHFGAYDRQGRLSFISDRTGIDNLYRWERGRPLERLSHVSTAFWLPAWTPEGTVLGSRLTSSGWDLVEIVPQHQPAPSATITHDSEPHDSLTEPNRAVEASIERDLAQTTVDSYRPVSTLRPRNWSPYFTATSTSRATELQIGATVDGFDATDVMGYSLFGAYNTRFGVPQLTADFAFRQLGPLITTRVLHYPDLLGDTILSRSTAASIHVMYPLAKTWSRWSPQAQLSAVYEHQVDVDTGSFIDAQWVPQALIALQYSNVIQSRLAISPESGRRWTLGSQGIFRGGGQTWKLFSGYTEYVRLVDHAILVAQGNLGWSSQVSVDGTGSSSYGTAPVTWREATPTSGIRSLFFRGYPGTRYFSTLGAQLMLETRFPVFRIFRGVGMFPLFFENIWAKAFVESGYLLGKNGKNVFFPALGGGLHLDLEAFLFFPVSLSTEYHQGLNTPYGGRGELFFQIIAASPLPF